LPFSASVFLSIFAPLADVPLNLPSYFAVWQKLEIPESNRRADEFRIASLPRISEKLRNGISPVDFHRIRDCDISFMRQKFETIL